MSEAGTVQSMAVPSDESSAEAEVGAGGRMRPRRSARRHRRARRLRSGELRDLRDLNEQLRRRVLEDPLTGLPNRILFRDRVGHTLAALPRGGQQLAVVFIDLDDFKLVNDRLGHDAGDRVLVEVAERLRGCLRPSDTAARLSGDEFAVLLTAPANTGIALQVAERIQGALRQPFWVGGSSARVSASLGIALSTPRTRDADDLLRDADAAMYRAKALGKSRYALFGPDLHAAIVRRLARRRALSAALCRGELVLRYQPIVNLADQRTVAVESLVRWLHPKDGLLLPREFLDLVDDAGLGERVGRWILGRACCKAAEWDAGNESALAPGGRTGLGMAVNLSARQLQRPELCDEVEAALSDSGLEPGRLTLEIAEDVLVGVDEHALAGVRRLAALGVELAMDDFGSGYAALGLLRRLPVSTVKLARTLAAGAEPDLALARAVVAVCHSAGIRTVAKGIETTEELAAARALDCELGQGHLFARPLTARVLARRLHHERAASPSDPSSASSSA